MNISKAVILGPGQKIKDQVGQVLYNAPEMCQNQSYDFKVDTWSFGAILFVLLSGVNHV